MVDWRKVADSSSTRTTLADSGTPGAKSLPGLVSEEGVGQMPTSSQLRQELESLNLFVSLCFGMPTLIPPLCGSAEMRKVV